MKKKIIVLAIAAVATSAAFAQSNVTIYGNVDMGYLHRSGNNGAVANTKGQNDLQSNASESLIGFKGAEDLGNGTKAIFDLAYKLQPDSNGGLNSAAHQYVGLTGGFGTVVAGFLDGVRYGVYGKYDPFGNYSVGAFQQSTAQYARAQNAVAYISPSFGGLTIVAAHATHTSGTEGIGNKGDDKLYTIAGAYVNGPLSIDLDYETTTKVDQGPNNRLYVATAGASYDFGVLKLSAIADKIHGEINSNISNTNNRDNFLLGVSVPVASKATMLASFGLVKDKTEGVSDANAKKYSLGARYALSKRTSLYADYTHISNQTNAQYTVNPMGNAGGTGIGVNGIDMGIKHSF